MAYHYRKTLFHTSFGSFVEDLTIELYKEGFMILASSDIRKIFKDILQVKMKKYEIISVIIPHLFNEMLAEQPFTGFVLPCQIAVCETANGEVEVAIVDPSRLMAKTVNNPTLQNITDEISRRLTAVLDLLAHKPVGGADGLV